MFSECVLVAYLMHGGITMRHFTLQPLESMALQILTPYLITCTSFRKLLTEHKLCYVPFNLLFNKSSYLKFD
jgi:hypothetical protein